MRLPTPKGRNREAIRTFGIIVMILSVVQELVLGKRMLNILRLSCKETKPSLTFGIIAEIERR
jgi:hypothetical protein